MLIENVKFLSAGELNLIRATVCRRVFHMLADPLDFSLCKGTRVVLMKAVTRGGSLVKNPVVRI